MDFRDRLTSKEVSLSNHTSFESLSPWDNPVLAQVPYEPHLPEKVSPSQQPSAKPNRGRNYRPTRSASSPPHMKDSFNSTEITHLFGDRDHADMPSKSSSPKSTTSRMPVPGYDQFYLLPSRVDNLRALEGQIDHGAIRSNSAPSVRGRQKMSSSRRNEKFDRRKREDSVPWRRRFKDAMKDFFKKSHDEDSDVEVIKDFHWTE